MKKRHLLFFLCLLFTVSIKAQDTNHEIQTNLDVANKNIKSAAEAFNLGDLSYHLKRAKVAVNDLKKQIRNINCSKALAITNEVSDLLDKALLIDVLNTKRHFISLSEPLILSVYYEYDVCVSSPETAEVEEKVVKTPEVSETESNHLTDLATQQASLLAQQQALEQRAKDLKIQLELQKKKESGLIKEEFINSHNSLFEETIATYNKMLKACNCNTKIIEKTSYSLRTKTIEQLKKSYLERMLRVSDNYVDKLKDCKK